MLLKKAIPKGPLLKFPDFPQIQIPDFQFQIPDIQIDIPQVDIPQVIPEIPTPASEGLFEGIRAGVEAATGGIVRLPVPDEDRYHGRPRKQYPPATPEVQKKMWDFLEKAGFKTPRPPNYLLRPTLLPKTKTRSKHEEAAISQVQTQIRQMKMLQKKAEAARKIEKIVKGLSPMARHARETAIRSKRQHPKPTRKHMPRVERVSKRRVIKRRPLYSGGVKRGGVIRRHDPRVHGN